MCRVWVYTATRGPSGTFLTKSFLVRFSPLISVILNHVLLWSSSLMLGGI